MRVPGLLLLAAAVSCRFVIAPPAGAQATSPSAASQSLAQSIDLPQMIRLEATLLQFAGGGTPLTPAENAQCVGIVQTAMREHPDKWRRVAAGEARVVQQLARGNPTYNGGIWDGTRYNYAFKSGADPDLHAVFLTEKAIIEAHDPVVAVDPQRHLLVTEHMLHALRAAAEWSAHAYGIPAPGANFEALVRANLRQQLPALDAKIADGMAHIVRYQPALAPYFAAAPANLRQNVFVRDKASTLGDVNDPKTEPWKLAEAAAMLSAFAATHGASPGKGAGHGLAEQNLMNGVVGTAVRGYSPHCPAAGIGTPADCTVH